MKKLVALIILSLSLILPMSIAVPSALASIEAVETCITLYENANTGNDHITWCNSLPSGLHDISLSNNTAGLHNGCNGITNQSSWNDCASSFTVGNLPANYRIVFYTNDGYNVHGGISICEDANGSYSRNIGGFLNDTSSSWKVEGGNC